MPIPGLNEPFPSRDAIVKPNGNAADVFVRWNEEVLLQRLRSSPVLAEPVVTEDDKTATVTGTIGGTQSGGFYAFQYYGQVLVAAGVSSGLQLSLAWTYNGIAQTETFTNLTTNLITSRQGLTYPLRIDPNATVSYTLTYASNPAAAMRYAAAMSLTLLQPLGT